MRRSITVLHQHLEKNGFVVEGEVKCVVMQIVVSGQKFTFTLQGDEVYIEKIIEEKNNLDHIRAKFQKPTQEEIDHIMVVASNFFTVATMKLKK